jgi:ketosteroid isomerase-like protein
MANQTFSTFQEQQIAAVQAFQAFASKQAQRLQQFQLDQAQYFNQQLQQLSGHFSNLKDWNGAVSAGNELVKNAQPQFSNLQQQALSYIVDSIKDFSSLASQQGENSEKLCMDFIGYIEEKIPATYSQPLIQTFKNYLSNNLHAKDAIQKVFQQVTNTLEQTQRSFSSNNNTSSSSHKK